MSRFGAIVLYRLGYFTTRSQSGPPMTTRVRYRVCSISAPPIWSVWAWEMRTYLMFFGVIGRDRVDQDNPLFCRQSPRRVNLAADEVEIVKNLGGFGVPAVTGR